MQKTALKMWKDEVDMNKKNRDVVVWTSLNCFRDICLCTVCVEGMGSVSNICVF
jgi:hypothetical protein